MWWYVIKKEDTDERVVYLYGCQTREVTGEIAFDRANAAFTVVRLADGDTAKGAEWFFAHLYRVITREGCPDRKQIAIG